MNRVKFGTTDLDISSISFGTAAISGEGGGYGFGNISESDALNLLSYTYDQGINFFDTAPIYGFDTAEKRLGKFIKSERDKKIIVSKCGLGWHDSMRVDHSNDPDFCVNMLEKSLRTMNTDYIDLYFVHAPHKNYEIEPLVDALLNEKKKGKIRYIGLSNFTKEDLEKCPQVDGIQNEMSLFKSFPEDVSELITEKSLGSMAWGTFDKGFLLDKIRKDTRYEKSDIRSKAPWWKKQNFDLKLKQLELIKAFANVHDMDLVSLCTNYNLSKDYLDSTICGGKSIAQWNDILNYKDYTIDFTGLEEQLNATTI